MIVISASIENWVRPFFAEFGDRVAVSCTKIDVREERVTGQFLTMNCYGAEKPKRLLQTFPLRKTYRLVAFGDSRGDKELIEASDTGYFRTSSGQLHCQRGEKDLIVEEVERDFPEAYPPQPRLSATRRWTRSSASESSAWLPHYFSMAATCCFYFG